MSSTTVHHTTVVLETIKGVLLPIGANDSAQQISCAPLIDFARRWRATR
jgi:hypothetical protein